MPARDDSLTNPAAPIPITARRATPPPDGGVPSGHHPGLAGLPAAGGAVTVNVPATYTSFVGRVTECAELAAVLRQPDVRLITLIGPGGVGKTRIATHLATETVIHDAFPGGVIFVELAGVDTAERMLPAIAQTLGLASGPAAALQQQLARVFAERRALLILDNLEHLTHSAPIITGLLAAATDLVILGTSRIPIGVSAEHVYPIAPLTVAPDAAADALRLFIDRARTADPAFQLDDESAAVIAHICEQVDGLPLAIELTAAQVRFLPPAALLPRLTQPLTLLTGGPRDAPQRHRTMHDNIAWSYDLLAPEDQAVFRRLAVFVDGFTLDAAEAVLGLDSPGPVLDAVRRLFEHNLLQRVTHPSGATRFRMLATIREFGLERLAQEDDPAAWRSRHALSFLDLALEVSDPVAIFGERVSPVQLGADLANLRAALVWFETTGDGARLIALAAALRRLWIELQFQEQGIAWLERALALGAASMSLPWARAHAALGSLLMFSAEWERSREHFAIAIASLREQGAYEELAMALVTLGVNSTFRHDLADAYQHIQEAATVSRQAADTRFAALFEAELASNLSVVVRKQGDLVEATRLAELALDASRRNGQQRVRHRIQGDLGEIYRARTMWVEALGAYQQSLHGAVAGIDTRALSEIIAGVACILVAWNRLESAARLFGAETALRARIGLSTGFHHDKADFDLAMTTAREGLDPAAFATAYRDGLSRALTETVAWVLAIVPPAPRAAARSRWRDLTARQTEITRLVAAARTDAEIADILSLSPRAVGWHVSNILTHLSLASRHELAALAREEGVIDRARDVPPT